VAAIAALAQRTERIRLGCCVAPIYMREPTCVAQLAATLHELSDGRAEVVFGIGNIAMLEQHGVEWSGTRPIARLREAHYVMRIVLDEGSIDSEGDFTNYSRVTTAARPVHLTARWPGTVDPIVRGDRFEAVRLRHTTGHRIASDGVTAHRANEEPDLARRCGGAARAQQACKCSGVRKLSRGPRTRLPGQSDLGAAPPSFAL
jgi:Luciferase-like monooxygenase